MDALREQRADRLCHGHLPPLFVLRGAGFKADRAGQQVDLGDAQAQEFPVTPAVRDSDFEDRTHPEADFRAFSGQIVVLLAFEKARPCARWPRLDAD
jgi:hypothetical protein